MRRLGVLGAATAVVLAACVGGRIAANPPVTRLAPPPTAAPPARLPDPQPVILPRDDGPHDRLTEWWYYTGHLQAGPRSVNPGRRFGFEYVVFRAERGGFAVSWVSHLAITDESGHRFLYSQRSEFGPQVDRSPRTNGGPAGFALVLGGGDPAVPGASASPAWRMSGAGGVDHLQAELDPTESAAAGAPGGLGIDLAMAGGVATLHDGDGWVDFGPAGGSYYYSRMRMTVGGSIVVDGNRFDVAGEAWFDHQWGDFISVGGGWDWFAVNLADGTDLTLSLVRDTTGSPVLVYGTIRDGQTHVASHLAADAFSVTVTEHWTSPATGAVYPAGWRISIPSRGLVVDLRPTVAGQELDTRPTTGVVYWEGSQLVSATRDGAPLGDSHGRLYRPAGEAYVELTGYGPPRGP
jgi:predicted secreted hydrolase